MKQNTSKAQPSSLSINDFSYELPDVRIAKYPLKRRDQSKLLCYRNGDIEEKSFQDLPQLLEPSDCLVFNDTRVVHARLHFQRESGACIEVLCLDPIEPLEVTEAFSRKKSTSWNAMVGNGKRWKAGELIRCAITAQDLSYELKAELLSKSQDTYIVRFTWDADLSFAGVLEQAGTLPIPPYLNRESEKEDEERYQTVYAEAGGSVAAPTAGLHFTKKVFDDLAIRKVKPLFVTLHVGAGTFKPVKSETMEGHEMHQERILLSKNAIEQMRDSCKHHRIVAVGTTSLRTIESIYWFGVKLLAEEEMTAFFVGQWDPYELPAEGVEASVALDAVLNWMHQKNLSYLSGYTQVLIAPGYEIRMADALITNFHQPESTLLLLVSAFIGEDWRNVYDYALEHDFRFLSFGDSSVLFRGSRS